MKTILSHTKLKTLVFVCPRLFDRTGQPKLSINFCVIVFSFLLLLCYMLFLLIVVF